MAIYRELFFNNLRSLLSQTFPVLRKIHATERWNSIVRAFMAHHVSKTPYFLEIPQEFLAFLENEYPLRDDDFAFLVELAHYEWVELALSVSQACNDMRGVDPAGDLLTGIPVKSVLAWTFAYSFPVHRINPEFLPTSAGARPTILSVCRKASDEIHFMELNAVTGTLLERIDNNATLSGRELLVELAGDIGYADVDAFLAHGESALRQMRNAEIVVGVK